MSFIMFPRPAHATHEYSVTMGFEGGVCVSTSVADHSAEGASNNLIVLVSNVLPGVKSMLSGILSNILLSLLEGQNSRRAQKTLNRTHIVSIVSVHASCIGTKYCIAVSRPCTSSGCIRRGCVSRGAMRVNVIT
jgi:hypothetical protein